VEIVAFLLILMVCWIVLTLLDLAVSGVLSFFRGISFKRAFAWGLLSWVVPVLALAYGMLIERNCYQVKYVELEFSNLPASFDGYRVVQLSDLHLSSFRYRKGSLERAVNKVNALNPDIIAFTGDMIVHGPDELDNTAGILHGLKADDGVISILGNHDYGIYMDHGRGAVINEDCIRELVSREQKMGWRVLLDESIKVSRGEDSIAIVGVENSTPSRFFPSRGNLKKASEGTEGMFRILLSHDPMHWEQEVIGRDYPLTLSGHTHANQFSLFGWCPSKYMFSQYRGLYEHGSQMLYVNIGLGETLFPARIGAPPEITVITLKRKLSE
jgi:uncharacterized protein